MSLADNTTSLQEILEVANSLPDAISVDDVLSETSTNPVQNKVITEALRDTEAEFTQKMAEGYYTQQESNARFVKLGYGPANDDAISTNNNFMWYRQNDTDGVYITVYGDYGYGDLECDIAGNLGDEPVLLGIIATPKLGYHAANKDYVDSAIANAIANIPIWTGGSY